MSSIAVNMPTKRDGTTQDMMRCLRYVILWYIRKHLCAPGFHISGDLSSKVYDFPMHFCPTTEISDIVLWKEQTKQIFFIELMYVCVQDNFANASLRKRTGAMTSQHN